MKAKLTGQSIQTVAAVLFSFLLWVLAYENRFTLPLDNLLFDKQSLKLAENTDANNDIIIIT